MDTIFIQPIFAPDKKRFERNWESLTSFFKYCDTYKYDIKFAIGGWCPDEYWNQFVNLVNSRDSKNKITLLRFERNYGKAVVVNKLYNTVREKNVQYKYILTCDSDILFPSDTTRMVERLEKLATESPTYTRKPFGMVSLNQLGANCHWKICYENQFTYDNGLGQTENIVYPNAPSGIAGGCLFISKNCWESVGGYRQLSIYAGDDAYLLVDAYTKGFSHQMSDSIAIIHPEENDELYAKWKHMVCQRDSVGGVVRDNLDSKIEEAENFWKNHK